MFFFFKFVLDDLEVLEQFIDDREVMTLVLFQHVQCVVLHERINKLLGICCEILMVKPYLFINNYLRLFSRQFFRFDHPCNFDLVLDVIELHDLTSMFGCEHLVGVVKFLLNFNWQLEQIEPTRYGGFVLSDGI